MYLASATSATAKVGLLWIMTRLGELMKIRKLLTAIHLSIGEALGLTHYRNCWDCKHCKGIGLGADVCGCTRNSHGGKYCYAIIDPCAAVWCHEFVEVKGND